MKELKTGITGTAETVVTLENSAAACDNSLPKVFSTPMLVALIEQAAINALKPYYDEDELSVGVTVNIKHMAATPLGEKVKAEATLIEIQGAKLKFEVKAFDEHRQISKGEHGRAIIKKS